jgi:hypothetical protein
MAMTVLQRIRLLAREFEDVPDDTVEQWIEMVSPLISRKVFGKLYDLGVALLAAHNMKLTGLGDDTYGTVAESMRLSSVSEGDSTISFNAAQSPTGSADDVYKTTVYGVQFLNILHRVVIPIHCGGE